MTMPARRMHDGFDLPRGLGRLVILVVAVTISAAAYYGAWMSLQ